MGTLTEESCRSSSFSPTELISAFLNHIINISLDTDNLVIDLEDADCLDRSKNLFINLYTQSQMEHIILNTTHLSAKLYTLGFHDLCVVTDTTDFFVHHLYLYNRGVHDIKAAANNIIPRSLRDSGQEHRRVARGAYDCLLMELSLHPLYSTVGFLLHRFKYTDYRTGPLIESFDKLSDLNIMKIDWLLLQNPTISFLPSDQPLPGQKYPGLKVAQEVFEIIVRQSILEIRDAVLNIPLYFHNAAIYANKGCYFINPEFDGVFQTLYNDLLPYVLNPKIGLAVVSRAIYHGRLIHIPTGKRVKWAAQEQILPLTKRIKSFTTSSSYCAIKTKFLMKGAFDIDWDGSPISNDEEWSQTISLSEMPAYFTLTVKV